ncbi:Mth938-like domain-containing protein [Pontivivens ytuae]|uniref:Mth938-like domain-containing protein n=1 Tax=Pontivivens ytuae TaxID=2789856 RepID=A0A7S9LSC1_9RHOB|nr:Mth938-like domain-containing protein [Pontivivens ytuae]QPH54343.1 Mth938-like domain-containing protein [Pontivivens ytuae]
MRLNEITYDGSKPVDGYGEGFFRVGGQVIEGGAALLPSGPVAWSGEAAPLVAEAEAIDVVLLGMGADIANPPEDLVAELEAAGMGVEVMSSPSACRTYNVLLSEGRRIAAAVFPVVAG